MIQKLALHGGHPVIAQPLEGFKSMGAEEEAAVVRVVRSGILSAYIGAPGEGFMGGVEVKSFEAKAAHKFGVKHAIAVNSWTSGLIAAVGAIGVEPGDEIITTPWTMSATAMAILHWNAIPVFADIDRATFNLNPESVRRNITPRTRAILAADIFGQSADMDGLRAIADEYNLKLLTDTAQAPGSMRSDGYTGTKADIGGFSLNYHKHIHCGEGGILVTNDDQIAERLCLIRNHAESVVPASSSAKDLANMIGYNFRMGELEAAIASEQLDKLEERVRDRQRVAAELDAGLIGLEGLATPYVPPYTDHVYYVYGMVLDTEKLGVSRDRIGDALRSEGVPGVSTAYQNIHRLPLFMQKIAYGTQGFPWSLRAGERDFAYGVGTCPVAEELQDRSYLGLAICMNQLPSADVAQIVEAFHKVWRNMETLRSR